MRSLCRRKMNIGTILSQEIQEGNPSSELERLRACKEHILPVLSLCDRAAQLLGILVQTEISQKLQPWIPTGFQL